MVGISALTKVSDVIWDLPVSYKEGMRVPARMFATKTLLEKMDDAVLDQISNVATLPGLVDHAMCMPDGHSGYGFPIGGVAAFDPETGVISPGGIGFDINCGMRLVTTNLTFKEVEPQLTKLVDRLYESVPAGVGSGGMLKLSRTEFTEMLERGAEWCVAKGYGWQEDLELTEENGCARGAEVGKVSDQAISRGLGQIGTLGSGNHYLEIQISRVGNVFDEKTAKVFGITIPDQVVIMFHCGSRGFGHQVATDYLRKFLEVVGPKFGIKVLDRELASAPFKSPEGQDYFAAMKCALNMSFANRQVILHRVREVFSEVFGRPAEALGLQMVYDVAHNTAKLEKHIIDGVDKELLVHRKGATRAFGPGMPDLPDRYINTGQPVIIGGSMETGSYLLAGVKTGAASFYSTAHGSGRTMSRTAARKQWRGSTLAESMKSRGIYVRTASWSGLAEEAGKAYKDIDEVVEATERAGLSRRVARFVPVGNIKG